MAYKTVCPECGTRIRFKARPMIYQRLVCKNCEVRLAVTRLRPLRLEALDEVNVRLRGALGY
jgi:lysine biosynthesis protein LysW